MTPTREAQLPVLDFVSVETVCRHCRGDGRSRQHVGDCGWCSGSGVLKVVRLMEVTELPGHGKIEDQT